MRKWFLFAVLILSVCNAAFGVYSFEDSVPPAGWQVYGGGGLQTSTTHYKTGNRSLQWDWQGGSYIKVLNPEKLAEVADLYSCGIRVWIYNEVPVQDVIEFAFGDESEAVAGSSRYEFSFGLNFKGWRAAWIRFKYDAVNSDWAGSEAMNCMVVKAPQSGVGRLFFDLVDIREDAGWWRSADYQVPFANGGLYPNLVDHWQYTYKWSQEPASVMPPASITQEQIDGFADIKQRLTEFLAGVPLAIADTVTETFNTTVNDNLDDDGSNNETVKISPDSGLKWGGYNAGSAGKVQFSSGGKLRFRDGSVVNGSYAYTIFNSESIRISTITGVYEVELPRAIRYMIRDSSDQCWYISDGVVPQSVFNVSSVSWTRISSYSNNNLNLLRSSDERRLYFDSVNGSLQQLGVERIDGVGFYIQTSPINSGHFTINDMCFSGDTESEGMKLRKMNLAALIDQGKAKFDDFNIVRNGDHIVGVPLFAHVSPYTPHIAEDFGEGVLFPLALDYIYRGNAESKEKFLLGLEYMHDQGWAQGSAMGSLDHQMNQSAGWVNAVFLMWDHMSPAMKEMIWGDLNWYCDFGEVYRRPFHRPGTTADRFQSTEIPRLMRILLMDDTPEKVRDMQMYLEWLGNAYSPVSGWGGTFKPDFVGWHHLGIQSDSYAPPAFHSAALVCYLLHRTEFALGQETLDNVTKALLEYRKYHNKYNSNVGISGRSGAGCEDGLVSEIPAYAYLVLCSDEPVKSQIAAVYKRLYDPDYPAVRDYLADATTNVGKMYVRTLKAIEIMEQVADLPIAAENDPQGHWVWNWGCHSVHRRDGWMASVKGWTRYVLNYESSGTSNELGWYQSHGGLQIFNVDGHLANGYDYYNGWDWTKYPGTTSLAESTNDLLSKDARRFSDEGFGGGVSFEKQNGLFALNLHDNLFGVELRAKKSCFFFDDLIVCLGSGISEAGGKASVQTTLFQNALPSAYSGIYNNSQTPTTAFPFSYDYGGQQNVWLLDAFGNGYYIPDADGLKIRKQNQSSLKPNGASSSNGNFAVAWFDHGMKPVTGGYEYAVKVGASPAEMSSFAAEPAYEVVRKDALTHIVKHDIGSIWGYAFFESVDSLEQGIVRAVDSPCLIMTRELEDGSLRLSLADPDLHVYDGGNPLQNTDGLKYTGIYFAPSQKSFVNVSLAGSWVVSSTDGKAVVVYSDGDQSVVQFECKDGLSCEAELVRADSMTFLPTDDTFAEKEKPDLVNGDLPKLKVRTNSVKDCVGYLKFEITGVAGVVKKAILKLKSQENSIDDTSVCLVADTSWSENTLAWNNRPIVGNVISTVVGIDARSWYEFDVTPVIDGDGAYSFALITSQGDTGRKWDSKEAVDSPVLEVVYEIPDSTVPQFTSEVIDKQPAREAGSYSASLMGDVENPDEGETLSFEKLSGAEWLSVAVNGEVSGVPGDSDVGLNVFRVRVVDSAGLSAEADIRIEVADTFSGQKGYSDLVGFASLWLDADVEVNTQADLDGDGVVDNRDFVIFGLNWDSGGNLVDGF